ncbi:[NU+] prion formation protein 1 [Basidiobolus ranarum]|uniref:Elongation factor 3 n=1 Tax=Basidiobolus ranarum TaxID=34480 RepID=A0ABR2WHZ7_9FUNG
MAADGSLIESKDVEVKELLHNLYNSETSKDCAEYADQIAALLKQEGIASIERYGVIESYTTAIKNKKSGIARESGLIGLIALFRTMGKTTEPLFIPLLPLILGAYADKGDVVREAAESAAKELFKLPTPEGLATTFLETLFEVLAGGARWQAKVGACELISQIPEIASETIAANLVSIVPPMSECLHDTKPEVAAAATKAMTEIVSVVRNQDIMPYISDLVQCMAEPDNVPGTISKLSSTTFVADVNGPTLSILIPLLVRALSNRSQSVLRKTVIIVDNLCRLVNDPKEAGQYLPELLPGLDRIIETSSPEVSALTNKARSTLLKAAGSVQGVTHRSVEADRAEVLTFMKSLIAKKDVILEKNLLLQLQYLAAVIAELVEGRQFEKESWINEKVSPYLQPFMDKPLADEITEELLAHYLEVDKKKYASNTVLDEDEGEILCDIDFSLAYGGMMLLNHTSLRLCRGHRYGLCGANGAGKSTLMRAIANGKLEGFPSQDELKTVFVEHTLQGEDAMLPIIDFISNDPKLSHVSREETAKALSSVGFTDEMQQNAVNSLSGGWKMKLELARAILINADILLLDEPTNHLDVTNIAWLENYLKSQKNVTSIIVSHDSSFLDNVTTDIIHYETKKLAYYKGNLAEFVKARPEAKSYYTLSASNVKFKFPNPGLLQGVKSKTKSIIRMDDVTYTYPHASKPSVTNVSLNLSLSSRVAILGANGAGKSTIVKLLTGEIIPQEGLVNKHPNLRVGYVAQHAFHHLERHLEKTPNQYIQWRYRHGYDREVLEKASRIMDEDDEKQMNVPIVIKGEKRKVECILGRTKLDKSFQYEVKWVGMHHRHNTRVPREQLIELGFSKIVLQFDEHIASAEGLGYRNLEPSEIRQHFEDVGLDGDIADYNEISGLSGGQKVKVVIAAAMWSKPHLLCLDEPTNYLDRDSLGGLAVAIRDWGGAVVMISHNDEFVGALCPEQWHVEAGQVLRKGNNAVIEESFADNNVEVKPNALRKKKKKMTRNEVKAQQVRRRERHLKWLSDATGQPKEPDTDSD